MPEEKCNALMPFQAICTLIQTKKNDDNCVIVVIPVVGVRLLVGVMGIATVGHRQPHPPIGQSVVMVYEIDGTRFFATNPLQTAQALSGHSCGTVYREKTISAVVAILQPQNGSTRNRYLMTRTSSLELQAIQHLFVCATQRAELVLRSNKHYVQQATLRARQRH